MVKNYVHGEKSGGLKTFYFFQKQSHISEHIGCNFTKEGCLAIVLEASEEYAVKLQSLWYVRKSHFKIWFDKNINVKSISGF
jgi:hypothetical protein